MSVLTAPAVPDAPVTAAPPERRPRHWGRFVLPTYSWLVIAYLVFPIAVMFVYSFNKSVGGVPQVSFSWNGFTTLWYHEWNGAPGLSASFWLSIRLALIAPDVERDEEPQQRGTHHDLRRGDVDEQDLLDDPLAVELLRAIAHQGHRQQRAQDGRDDGRDEREANR